MSDGRLVDIRAQEFDDKGCEPMLLFWYGDVGDAVVEGQDLCEIETAKAVFVIQAPASGKLVEILAAEGEPVASGQVLGRIEVE